MKQFLLFLLLGCTSFTRAQETGKPVDFDNPKVGDYIAIENFLYDLDGISRIRPDSYRILQDVVESLKRLPNWKFRLESHTDCRASHAYNDTLTQARADTLLNYVVSFGFPAWRITAKGMGERMLLMEKCSCDLTDYINQICDERDHQLNRRVLIRLAEEIPEDHGTAINVKFPSVGQRKGFLVYRETMDSVCRQISMTLDSIPSATYSITLVSQSGRADRRKLKKQLIKRIRKDNAVWKVRVWICQFGHERQDRVVVQIIAL